MTTTEERRAARLEARYRGYAAHFALDWNLDRNTARGATSDPTDANLAIVLETCARPPRPEDYPHIRRHVVDARVSLTADWLRGVVWGQATNPMSKPVIEAMATAVELRAWASLAVLAEALDGLEALTCVLDANPAARGVAARAAAFARQAMEDAAPVDGCE